MVGPAACVSLRRDTNWWVPMNTHVGGNVGSPPSKMRWALDQARRELLDPSSRNQLRRAPLTRMSRSIAVRLASLIVLLFASGSTFATELNDRLWLAVSDGDVEAVKAALQDGVDVDYVAKGGLIPLHIAVRDGRADIVSLLLQRGANVNIVNDDGETPLIRAVSFGLSKNPDKARIVEMLIASGGDVRRADRDGFTPLHLAASWANREVVKLLLDRGALLNALNRNNRTPLDVAGDASTADFLLARGARIGGYSSDGKKPLARVDQDLFMATVAGSAEGIRTAVARGAHVNIRDSSRSTALIRATYLGRLEAVSAFLEQRADIEEADDDGRTALHVAAGQGFPKIVELLLAHHANIDTADIYKDTPLGLVADARTAQILLRAGADANATDQLCSAAITGNAELIELLLSYGADTKACRIGGNTPLLEAINYKHWEVARTLLDHGADANASGDGSSTPLTLAAGMRESGDAVARLLEHGGDPNAPNKDGDTPLIEAARYGQTKVVKLLLDGGAKIATKGNGGITALAAAKDIETADMLISRGANVDDLIPFWFGKETKLNRRQTELFKAVAAGDDRNAVLSSLRRTELSNRFPDGSTILQIATMLGRTNIIDWVLGHGDNPSSPNADGLTPLHMAVAAAVHDPQKQVRIMELLLKHNAAIDATDKNGMTPLHLAAGTYNQVVVDFLVQRGADPLRRNNDGLTPIQFAQRSQFGTGVLAIMTPDDARRKSATIATLRVAVSGRALGR